MTKKYLNNEKFFLSFLEEKLELSKNSLINNSDLENSILVISGRHRD